MNKQSHTKSVPLVRLKLSQDGEEVGGGYPPGSEHRANSSDVPAAAGVLGFDWEMESRAEDSPSNLMLILQSSPLANQMTKVLNCFLKEKTRALWTGNGRALHI